MKTYRKTTQRTQALEGDYFENSIEFWNTITRLLSRCDKSNRRWKSDRRIAHSMLRRHRSELYFRSKRLERYGSPSEYHNEQFVRSMSNRVFKVSGLSDRQLETHPMRSAPWWELKEYNFKDRYYPDRFELDKQQSKRSKN